VEIEGDSRRAVRIKNEVSKRMHEAKTIREKMPLLNELQRILKESKEVLDEIHKKQSSLRR
jgi:hypothetical protein